MHEITALTYRLPPGFNLNNQNTGKKWAIQNRVDQVIKERGSLWAQMLSALEPQDGGKRNRAVTQAFLRSHVACRIVYLLSRFMVSNQARSDVKQALEQKRSGTALRLVQISTIPGQSNLLKPFIKEKYWHVLDEKNGKNQVKPNETWSAYKARINLKQKAKPLAEHYLPRPEDPPQIDIPPPAEQNVPEPIGHPQIDLPLQNNQRAVSPPKFITVIQEGDRVTYAGMSPERIAEIAKLKLPSGVANILDSNYRKQQSTILETASIRSVQIGKLKKEELSSERLIIPLVVRLPKGECAIDILPPKSGTTYRALQELTEIYFNAVTGECSYLRKSGTRRSFALSPVDISKLYRCTPDDMSPALDLIVKLIYPRIINSSMRAQDNFEKSCVRLLLERIDIKELSAHVGVPVQQLKAWELRWKDLILAEKRANKI